MSHASTRVCVCVCVCVCEIFFFILLYLNVGRGRWLASNRIKPCKVEQSGKPSRLFPCIRSASWGIFLTSFCQMVVFDSQTPCNCFDILPANEVEGIPHLKKKKKKKDKQIESYLYSTFSIPPFSCGGKKNKQNKKAKNRSRS
ncbi:hypothetical protein LZ31DRAFT_152081 [Colletotrichum somersetense]|nr:hypothetical protein LZ31DRAFT_152081 [Colletotrichum somersetense]